jgi:hypothetical protein
MSWQATLSGFPRQSFVASEQVWSSSGPEIRLEQRIARTADAGVFRIFLESFGVNQENFDLRMDVHSAEAVINDENREVVDA